MELRKASVQIPATTEWLQDQPRPATPEEHEAALARHADLRARGLLADDGTEIFPR